MKNFQKNDNYSTPLSAWKNIVDYLPKDKVYWDPFYMNGNSKDHLESLGLNVIHEDIDFFESADLLEYDIIITNPPFSIKRRVLDKLFEIGKPFLLIMPVNVITYKFYRKFVNETTLIIPPSRIQFVKSDGINQGSCPFDCFYYFWKFDLPTKLILP